jgi:protein-tyrosine phosphatase
MTDAADAVLPRVIVLQNASNLRDLGGWRAGARRVRHGLVFRAPALVDLSPGDVAAVAALGLKTVCDLRGRRERALAPVDLAGTDNRSLPIEPSVGGSLKDILRTGQVEGSASRQDMMALLREAYVAYALQSAGQYRQLFAAILEEDSLPLLLHCSAGKDRTGFGSALLLSALGVGWDDVMADYLATNRLWRRETARNFDLPDAVKDALLEAHAEMLEAAFTALRAQSGSLDAYLRDSIGLDRQARERLEALLLED